MIRTGLEILADLVRKLLQYFALLLCEEETWRDKMMHCCYPNRSQLTWLIVYTLNIFGPKYCRLLEGQGPIPDASFNILSFCLYNNNNNIIIIINGIQKTAI